MVSLSLQGYSSSEIADATQVSQRQVQLVMKKAVRETGEQVDGNPEQVAENCRLRLFACFLAAREEDSWLMADRRQERLLFL